MQVSKKGIDFLIDEEGNIPYAYYCQANVKTIGVGMVIKYFSATQKALLKKVAFADIKQVGKIYPAIEDDNTVYTISKLSCEILLKEKLETFGNAVNKAVKINLTQNQFDALISLCFNIGISNFNKSTLLKRVNENASATEIMKWFNVWNKSKGKILPVLVKRRKREAKLFLDNSY